MEERALSPREVIRQLQKDLELAELLSTITDWAEEQHDGHVTLMRFTTGWKVLFGSPVLREDFGSHLEEVPPDMDLLQACHYALSNRTRW